MLDQCCKHRPETRASVGCVGSARFFATFVLREKIMNQCAVFDWQSFEIETIQTWLHRIGEQAEDREIVLSKCRSDPEALVYFLKHSRGEFLRR